MVTIYNIKNLPRNLKLRKPDPNTTPSTESETQLVYLVGERKKKEKQEERTRVLFCTVASHIFVPKIHCGLFTNTLCALHDGRNLNQIQRGIEILLLPDSDAFFITGC